MNSRTITKRAELAGVLNRAGALRRAQLTYPCRSWSETVEIRHLLRRARMLLAGMV